MSLILKDVCLPLAGFNLELSLEIAAPITVLFGPSGSGKTSLLDLIAGLRRARSAFIQFDNDVLTDTARSIHVPSRRRGLGYVPQDLALFPHLNVRQNLLYGHKQADPRFRFDHIVELLEIGGLLDRGVTQLSGGERQRVALARALLTSPRLLLFDEPLANLDQQLKVKILPYLGRVRDEFHIPMLYVTHDRFEALSLADDMIILMDGKIAQSGPIQDVFNHPSSRRIADLLAIETIEAGKVLESKNGLQTVSIGNTRLLAVESQLPPETHDVFVCIRAEDVVLVREQGTSGSARNRLAGTVRSLTPQGRLVTLKIDCGFPLSVLLTSQACEELALKPGDHITALVKASNIHLIPRS